MTIRRSILSLLLVACTSVVCSSNIVAAEKLPAAAKPLVLASGSALVVDLQSDRVVYSSNPDVVVPIASVTKLMAAMVVLDARLPMSEMLDVDISETAEMKGVYSRVRLNSRIDRQEMLHLALMSSENRAAASLAHHYPGGTPAFVKAMNAKARALGMTRTHFKEPTGLSEYNRSTARDLIRLVKAAYQYPLIRELSTTPSGSARFTHPNYTLGFFNTNPLTRNPKWDIRLTKTGFTDEAGHCLVMVTVMNGRPVALALLDALGKRTHVGDASRIRTWVETGRVSPVPAEALRYKLQKSQLRQVTSIQRAD
ncbi:D-alanyl-D-alanine endopeptidase [compost metagenome]|uniref:D-alanyl-D-alanine endopeptidase (Penicillin-binding protein 7) n=1 Tax=Pseudomonas jinjuensis TaxID=198616 RepID=A0A1H0DE34_9PSED|nr:D-alanyl-D-alanine endopeptidase [Pseudomonas jinjuensis]SDN68286.1 D-alanyl-D-alanine endopeptidase (penicillin-binding protein 7) [Pseudomonas jinjuensis]